MTIRSSFWPKRSVQLAASPVERVKPVILHRLWLGGAAHLDDFLAQRLELLGEIFQFFGGGLVFHLRVLRLRGGFLPISASQPESSSNWVCQYLL